MRGRVKLSQKHLAGSWQHSRRIRLLDDDHVDHGATTTAEETAGIS